MAQDGFEDGNFNANPVWSIINGAGGTPSVIEAAAKNGTYGLRFAGDGAGEITLQTNVALDNLDTWLYVRTSNVAAQVAALWRIVIVTGTTAMLFIANSKFSYRSDSAISDFTAVPSNNTWYIWRIQWIQATQKVRYWIYDEDGNLIEDTGELSLSASGAIDRIQIEINNQSGNTDWDDVGYSDEAPPGPPPAVGQYMNMLGYW